MESKFKTVSTCKRFIKKKKQLTKKYLSTQSRIQSIGALQLYVDYL